MSTPRSLPVPSLIQGISQQEPQSRASSSAEDQFDCLNDVLDGCVARNGSILVGAIAADYVNPFVFDFRRSQDENYSVVVEGAVLRVFNKETGTEAAVTVSPTNAAAISTYLTTVGEDRESFVATQLEDITFLGNKEVKPAMATTLSPARPNTGVAFFKSGNYLTRYRLALYTQSTVYSAEFVTPDNSDPWNARLITTDRMAATFEDAFNTVMAPAIATDGNGAFTITRDGGTLIIKGPVGQAFELDTFDGAGDSSFIAFTDYVSLFNDLPARCEEGIIVRVSGTGRSVLDDYFVEFRKNEGDLIARGTWEEVVAPETPISLNAATMPLVLKNTAVDTFTLDLGTWGDRLSGDGDNTAKDPSFIGKNITSLQFIDGRLAIWTEGSAVLSNSSNAFVFFPDTAQTILDTAPIDDTIANGTSTIIRQSVIAGGNIQGWGDGIQIALEHGADPLKETTVDNAVVTNYEFDGEVAPKAMGLSTILFGTALGAYAKLTEVIYRASKPAGEIEITSQCPRLIKGDLKQIAVGQASKTFVVSTEENDTLIYVYQWYNNGDERVLSAWNKWRLDGCLKVLHSYIFGNKLYLMLKWDGFVSFEHIILDPEGDEADQRFALRMDHRIDLTLYPRTDNGDGTFSYTLPFAVDPTDDRWTCVEINDTPDVSQRGRSAGTVSFPTPTELKVAPEDGMIVQNLYFGRTIRSTRTFSKLSVRKNDIPLLPDEVYINGGTIYHAGAADYKVIVEIGNEEAFTQGFVSRVLGDSSQTNDKVPVENGTFSYDVGGSNEATTITLLNDTVFPSAWTAMRHVYTAVIREG